MSNYSSTPVWLPHLCQASTIRIHGGLLPDSVPLHRFCGSVNPPGDCYNWAEQRSARSGFPALWSFLAWKSHWIAQRQTQYCYLCRKRNFKKKIELSKALERGPPLPRLLAVAEWRTPQEAGGGLGLAGHSTECPGDPALHSSGHSSRTWTRTFGLFFWSFPL